MNLTVMAIEPIQSQGDPERPGAPSLKMKVVVYLSLIASVALALSLIAATAVGWLTQRTPSSMVVFHANAALTDSVITLTDADGSSARTIPIQATADFATPVFVAPGTYSISVKHADSVVFHDSMYVAEGSRYDINLGPPAATRP